ncbi:MAG: hypothetical protein H9893_09065 [Candidatus Niameybacter stercoravium]|nr:hypothetical protein [Candidatus Niameybacter stercoravium]
MRNIIGCIAIITFLCTGCSSNKMEEVYMQDDKLTNEGDSYSLHKEEQCVEGQVYTGQLEFEGVDTLWDYEAEEDMEVEVSYCLSVSHGKAKLVYIAPNDQTYIIVENKDRVKTDDLENAVLQIKKGRNRIKLVAMNKAQIDLKVKVSEGNLNTLGC